MRRVARCSRRKESNITAFVRTKIHFARIFGESLSIAIRLRDIFYATVQFSRAFRSFASRVMRAIRLLINHDISQSRLGSGNLVHVPYMHVSSVIAMLFARIRDLALSWTCLCLRRRLFVNNELRLFKKETPW